LTDLSEWDSIGLICTNPTALWRISRYSRKLCQWLGGDLVATATVSGIENRLMYDNQYGAKLFVILELELKLKIDLLPMSFCSILYIIVQAIKICLALISEMS
jgi:hypothetical protein